MVNMSYCRFHNTRMAMDECLDALIDDERISEEEIDECRKLFEIVCGFLCGEGVEVDMDAFEEWFEELEKRVED